MLSMNEMDMLGFVVGSGFGILALIGLKRGPDRKLGNISLFVSCVVWVLYRPFEYYFVSTSQIRPLINLLFVYPLLAIATLFPLQIWTAGLFKPGADGHSGGTTSASRVLLIPVVVWIIYGIYEHEFIGSDHYAIRLDLLVIYPFLAVVTLTSLRLWFASLKRKSNRIEKENDFPKE